ncbi:MAG: enoyl-CoA hydratase-related protein [Gemmatimonadetes bacterium]|nr:enoyl-CoA hydratase-related protein [Gemmatimonadota bacterium]
MAEAVNVLVDKGDAIATLTINRPDKLNALNEPTRRELIAAFEDLKDDDEIRVAVLTGAGKAFIAGADITEFEGRSPVDQYRAMSSPTVFEAADAFPKPIIAAINGFCLGGGCEIAMACDIRIASDKAKLGQPEVNLGIIPGGGGTQRLPRLVGLGTALKLMYTGDMINADEALRIGLVDEVVPADELMARVRELAASIAQKSPVALQLIKEAARASVRAPLDEGLRHEKTLFGLAFSSEDKAEGVAAFLEKRTPEFKGR